jgi:hypothetical protein
MIKFKQLIQILEESQVEHHASVIPLTGFSPISHMGHAKDLGGAMAKLPGKKHLGVSAKSDVFDPSERASILHRQWNQKDLHTHVVKSAGETVANAFHSLPKNGKKHLHLLVGSDRKEFAEGLKKSLEAGKIKEMGEHKWDHIHIHYPEDGDRSHGMSGTKMRTAVANNDINEFHRHLGDSFSRDEAEKLHGRIKDAIDSGKLKVKR